jgi:hypothetical protein
VGISGTVSLPPWTGSTGRTGITGATGKLTGIDWGVGGLLGKENELG